MKGNRWPIIIVSALALHMAASAFFVYLATSNPSFAVEEDYYQKALDWDKRRAQDAVNRTLGWRLASELNDDPASSGAALQVLLSDSEGIPIDGAVVEVEAFPIARADQILRQRLHRAGEGRYAATLTMRRQGRWELRFVATRGADRFTHVIDHFLLRLPRGAEAQ